MEVCNKDNKYDNVLRSLPLTGSGAASSTGTC